MALLLNDLKPHRWTALYSSLPEVLKEQDVQLSPRHCSYRYIMKRQIEVIVKSWNNPANTDLCKVVQQIATDYRAYIKEVDPNLTAWALLVKKEDFSIDDHFREICSDHYYEYEIGQDYSILMTRLYQQNDEDVDVSKFIRKTLLEQNGFCAEQQHISSNEYAPVSEATKPKPKVKDQIKKKVFRPHGKLPQECHIF